LGHGLSLMIACVCRVENPAGRPATVNTRQDGKGQPTVVRRSIAGSKPWRRRRGPGQIPGR
jgi:hypothetical protein